MPLRAGRIANRDEYGQAYDSHCNLVLGDVEETIYVVEEDENEEEITRVGHPMQTRSSSCAKDGRWADADD